MFKRVLIEEDLTSLVAMIAFGVSFIVFLYFSTKAFFIKKADAEKAASIPFEKKEMSHE